MQQDQIYICRIGGRQIPEIRGGKAGGQPRPVDAQALPQGIDSPVLFKEEQVIRQVIEPGQAEDAPVVVAFQTEKEDLRLSADRGAEGGRCGWRDPLCPRAANDRRGLP